MPGCMNMRSSPATRYCASGQYSPISWKLYSGKENNMDKDVETAIVKTFFNKKVQDRVLFELFSSDKRRNRGLNRLCHDYRQTLREEYLFEIPTTNSDPKEIADILKRNGAGKSCYAMSWNPDIDGKHLSIDEALDAAIGYGFPSFILCVPNELAYFEAEQSFGPPPRFMVKQ